MVSGTTRNVRGLPQGGGLENPPPSAKWQDRERLSSRSHLKHVQENLLRVKALVTVLKLTQVGETSSLRRSGERWLRNSAIWPRNFGIRGTFGSFKASEGHSKSVPATVYQKHRSLLTRKWMYRD